MILRALASRGLFIRFAISFFLRRSRRISEQHFWGMLLPLTFHDFEYMDEIGKLVPS